MNDRNPSYGSASSFGDPARSEVSDPLAEVGAAFDQPEQSVEQSTTDSTTQKSKDVAETAKQKTGEVAGKAQEKASEVTDKAKEKAGQVTGKAQEKSDQGIDKAASGLGQAAELLRQQGEQRSGTVATAAAMTAGKLDGASQYLKDKDTNQLLTDLEALVRQKPVESLLVAAGAGFLLSKIFG